MRASQQLEGDFGGNRSPDEERGAGKGTVLIHGEHATQVGISADEVRRFNPALVRSVPAGGMVYLPKHVAAFGPDVSFWHRPAGAAFDDLLDEFVRLDVPLERWDSRAFDSVLRPSNVPNSKMLAGLRQATSWQSTASLGSTCSGTLMQRLAAIVTYSMRPPV